jgi:hypothetical protein
LLEKSMAASGSLIRHCVRSETTGEEMIPDALALFQAKCITDFLEKPEHRRIELPQGLLRA